MATPAAQAVTERTNIAVIRILYGDISNGIEDALPIFQAFGQQNPFIDETIPSGTDFPEGVYFWSDGPGWVIPMADIDPKAVEAIVAKGVAEVVAGVAVPYHGEIAENKAMYEEFGGRWSGFPSRGVAYGACRTKR